MINKIKSNIINFGRKCVTIKYTNIVEKALKGTAKKQTHKKTKMHFSLWLRLESAVVGLFFTTFKFINVSMKWVDQERSSVVSMCWAAAVTEVEALY